jgi:hypothetical protein
MATSHNVTNPINTNGVSAVPGASNRDLGLKLYSNEVIAAFTRRNIFLDMVKTRTISGGISSQFIVTGQASESDAATHTPGSDVAAQVLKVTERVISITDRVYYSHFVDKLDEKLAQYDLRGELAKQAAEALATKVDKAVGSLVMQASETAATDTQIGGHIVDMGTKAAFSALSTEAKGDAIVESLFDANVAFNAADVPMDGRILVTTPQNYAYIVQSQKAVNRDFTNGNGGIDSGEVMNIAGTPIKWSNHLPTRNTANNADIIGLFFQSGCVGVVKAMDITSEANYIPEKLGDLLTSYYALGMGVLEPGKAASLVTTDA